MDDEIDEFRAIVREVLGVGGEEWRIRAIVAEAEAALKRAYARGRRDALQELMAAVIASLARGFE